MIVEIPQIKSLIEGGRLDDALNNIRTIKGKYSEDVLMSLQSLETRILIDMGEYHESIKIAEKNLHVAKKINNPLDMIESYNGRTYFKAGMEAERARQEKAE